MDQFATRFADFLDDKIVKRVRSLTDDGVNRLLVGVVLGLVALMLVLLAVIFFLVALFRMLGTWVTVEGAYAIFGGLFVIAGAFVWSKRFPKSKPTEGNTNG